MSLLDKLIEKKDLKAYLTFRIKHLELERQKVPFTVQEHLRDRVNRKLSAKIDELRYLQKQLVDLKNASKFECSKVRYLADKKIEILKSAKLRVE